MPLITRGQGHLLIEWREVFMDSEDIEPITCPICGELTEVVNEGNDATFFYCPVCDEYV